MRERKAVANAAKRVFHAADMSESRRQRDCFVETFVKTAPKAVACLEDAFDDATAMMHLPEKYRKRLRSTNMQERLNEEIRRRERVYLDIQEFREWQAAQAEKPSTPASLPITV